MNSRLRFLAVAAWALSLGIPATSNALQKKSVRLPDDSNEWRGGSTACSIRYYNTCTGWVWVWSGFAPEDRVGVNVQTCCPPGTATGVVSAEIFVATSAPSGYGFTGTIDLWAADENGCPTGPSLASQPMLPTELWSVPDFSSSPVPVPDNFVITYTFGPGPLADPTGLGTDHPAAGPTGPAACGTCFPNSRTIHSFSYGNASTPACPGSVFNDGICDAELMWEINLVCTTSVEQNSWGQIKGLYR
jgi:hypothetical protein